MAGGEGDLRYVGRGRGVRVGLEVRRMEGKGRIKP